MKRNLKFREKIMQFFNNHKNELNEDLIFINNWNTLK
jgi:hypothetical protein